MPLARPLATAPVAVRAPAARGRAAYAGASRAASERRWVAVLSSLVVVAMVVASGFAVRSSMADTESRAQLGDAFGQAALRQEEFRARNARFANWTELSESGMRLPAELRVLSSNATSSHWYLQLRDRNTGVICARVGQLPQNRNRSQLSCE